MAAPQIIFIVLMAVDLLGTAYLHGKPRAPWNLCIKLVDVAIVVGVIWWGGFFEVTP
jgi:hypothetical protein